MLRASTFTLGSIVLTGLAVAQTPMDRAPKPIQAPIMDGGTYHVASGTWTRTVPPNQLLGSNDIVYNNSAYTPFFEDFGIANETSSFEVVDAARVPSIGAGVGADRDRYLITSVDVGYCIFDDTAATGPLSLRVTVYNPYRPCSDPSTATIAGQFEGVNLPGTDPMNLMNGFATCWVVNFDLTGGNEICLEADGETNFDNNLDFDSFGIGYEFDPGGAGGYVGNVDVGPIIAGDREWTARETGEIMPASTNGGGGGGGTYYGPTETCLPTGGGLNSSGLDNEDDWWVGERVGTSTSAGCYFYGGGYSNPTGCNANGTVSGITPPSSFYCVLRADASNDCTVGPPPFGTPFCAPLNNSTGFPTLLRGTLNTGVGAELHLEATGGPPNQFGYFLVGTLASPTPTMVSQGLLCLGSGGGNFIGRYNLPGTNMNSLSSFDAVGQFQNTFGTSTVGTGFDVPMTLPVAGNMNVMTGTTYYFQLWHRDGMDSNFSNGWEATF